MSTHAFLSPSGAPAWTLCLAKPHMELGLPDQSSRAADEGTAAHELRALCLTNDMDAAAYLGRIIEGFEVTDEMAEAVQKSVDVIRALPGDKQIEVSLDISHITGEPGARGTGDTVILDYDNATLVIDDYKHGRGVSVFAEENEQLLIYAGAALTEYEMLADWQRVTMRISQPRIDNDSEWSISVADLRSRLAEISSIAARILAGDKDSLPLVPGEKQCRFCKAKATCPALLKTVMADFDAVRPPEPAPDADLARVMANADLIESWIKAVRAEVERRLLAGQAVPGFKLVEGRRGSRKWSNEAEAEAALKSMRVKHDQMYDYSVISPTSAEKLAKADVLGERQWTRLQSLITQSDGKPSVAPVTDKRPAINVGAALDDFAAITG
jgi:hypothetical protein